MADDLRVRRKLIAEGDESRPAWADVQTQLHKAYELNPRSAGVRFIRGAIAMDRDQNWKAAIKHFEEALVLDPSFTKARYYLGLALDHAGDRARAVKEMERITLGQPGHRGAQQFLAKPAPAAPTPQP